MLFLIPFRGPPASTSFLYKLLPTSIAEAFQTPAFSS
jgi:hypothetical protein